jgi:hypothetical protein
VSDFPSGGGGKTPLCLANETAYKPWPSAVDPIFLRGEPHYRTPPLKERHTCAYPMIRLTSFLLHAFQHATLWKARPYLPNLEGVRVKRLKQLVHSSLTRMGGSGTPPPRRCSLLDSNVVWRAGATAQLGFFAEVFILVNQLDELSAGDDGDGANFSVA